MRIILFLFLFSTGAFAQDCSKLDVYLYGNIIYKNKVLFNEFPKVWTVNGDRFSSLFLQVKEGLKVDEVLIEIASKNHNKKIKRKVSAEKKKKGFMHIENINFQKDILPSYRLLPMKMKLRIFNKNKKICEKEYRLEVII